MDTSIEITSVKIASEGYILNGQTFVPDNMANRYRQAIQEWIDAGNTPEAEHTLQEYKEAKKAQINAERSTKLSTLTIDLDGMTFDADADARENIVASVTAINAGVIPVPDPISWRDHNNVTRSLSHLKLLELAGIMFAAIDAVYNESWTMKAAVDAAADEAAVDAVDWS